jgi:hypothetical protein
MKQEFFYNNIIIGGSLEALLYSFVSETPIIIKEPIIPFELEKVTNLVDFKFLGYEGVRDIYKSELWDRLTFLLSMGGLVLVPNIVKNIRSERKAFTITTIDNSRIKIRYNERIDFDKISNSSLNVYDWFHVHSGTVHPHIFIEDRKSRFVNKLFFHSPRRIGLNRSRKDVVAFSKIRTADIESYESSESYARLKVLKMMKDNGIRGTANGYNKRGLQLHYAVKIEHSHRDIIKNYTPLHSTLEILEQRKREGKLWNSTKKLFRHRQISTLRNSIKLPDKI